MTNKIEILKDLAKHRLGESPLWDGSSLYYVDIPEGRIHRHNFTSGEHKTITMGSFVGFISLDERGHVIVGIGNGEIWRVSFEEVERELICRPLYNDNRVLMNDGACDRAGRLWVGTKNINEKGPPIGTLYRYDGGPYLTEIMHPVHISNGIAWSPDNKLMYYNDSRPFIWQFDYDLSTGLATNRRLFARLSEDGSVPDGMTVDQLGRVYCAISGGSRVQVFTSDGTLEEIIALPSALPIAGVAFGGPHLSTLFVTTASDGLDAAQLLAHPDSGYIFAIERKVPGLPEPRFSSARFVESAQIDVSEKAA